MLFVFETHSGERLIGTILDHPPDNFSVPTFMFTDGIWIKRKTHITFLANSEIKFKRAATVFDKEN